MIELILQTDCSDGKATLHVGCEDEDIYFTFFPDNGTQFDFPIEKEEWELFKNFLDVKLASNKENK